MAIRSHATGAPPTGNGHRISVVLLVCLFLTCCKWHFGKPNPAIEFTRVPDAGEGDAENLDFIEGRVTGRRPDQRIVLYAKAGVWWVQPQDVEPFTKIASDSSWKSPTHIGTEYAALLVDPSYMPPTTAAVLPTVGGGVSAVASVHGRKPPPPPPHTLRFSGYEWNSRYLAANRLGAVNYYDPANVWTDAHGYLHMRIARRSDRWMCSQVSLTRSLGYGTYSFTVEDITHLEPAAELSLLTWDAQDSEQYHRELDIEMSRWGIPDNKNADFVVQPSWFPENKVKFVAPPGPLVQVLHWEPGKASFEAVREGVGDPKRRIIFSKVFTTAIPSPGSELVNIDFCDFKHGKVSEQNEAEVVIEKFQYLP